MQILAADTELGLRSKVAIIVVGVIGSCISIILPGILSAIIEIHGITQAQASLVVSAELGALMVATVGAASLVATRNRRAIALPSLLLIAAGNLMTGLVSSYYLLLGGRIVSGLGEGIAMVVAAASLAATERPDRLFAIYIASNMAAATALFSAMQFFTRIDYINLIFFVIAILALLSIAAIPLLPAYSAGYGESAKAPGTVKHAAKSSPSRMATILLGLLGTLLFFVAIGLVWPLMGQIGKSLGISDKDVTAALAASTTMGIVSGLFTSWFGTRIGRVIPLTVGSIGLIAVMLALASRRAEWFAVLTSAFMFCWIFTVPYYLGIMAETDRSGRAVSFSFTMQVGGFALGPVLAAICLKNGRSGFGSPIFYGAVICLLAMIAMLASDLRNRRFEIP